MAVTSGDTARLADIQNLAKRIKSNYPNNNTFMTGATSSAAGTSGLVPAPAAGDETAFLRGDGTWAKLDTLSLSATRVILLEGKSKTVTVMRPGSGVVSAKTSDTSVAMAKVSGTTVTVTAAGIGSAVIIVTVAADGEHNAMSAVISVAVMNPVFGVCWDMSNSSTALSRLTAENDPNGYVSVDIAAEPVAAVGDGDGSSPFDDYAPWNGMEEYNVADDGTVTASMDEAFSRSSGNVMVYIPEFYYKIVNDADSNKRYFYISSKAADGFTKHPGSGCYVGRYNAADGYVSQTGLTPLVTEKMDSARTNVTGKGTGWYLYDYATWCAILLLYLVEYADFDGQSRIGQGVVNTSGTVNSGGTDSMVYHTGHAAGNDGETAMQYRHIENLWGNVSDELDGVMVNDGTLVICPNRELHKHKDAYIEAGTLWSNRFSLGWIKALGYSETFPWSFYSSAIGGSASTYIPDYCWTYQEKSRQADVGGNFTNGTQAGPFACNTIAARQNSSEYSGLRLSYVPTDVS